MGCAMMAVFTPSSTVAPYSFLVKKWFLGDGAWHAGGAGPDDVRRPGRSCDRQLASADQLHGLLRSRRRRIASGCAAAERWRRAQWLSAGASSAGFVVAHCSYAHGNYE